MAFRLPENLGIGKQYGELAPDSVTALEESLPANSRMLVGLRFSERYEGFEADCERANERLLEEPGILPWPEYPQQFVIPDVEGQPIAWVSYQSSPAWWLIIVGILGAIFALPILSVVSSWIVDLVFPGLGSVLSVAMLVGMGFLMFYLVKEFTPVAKEVAPELIAAKAVRK